MKFTNRYIIITSSCASFVSAVGIVREMGFGKVAAVPLQFGLAPSLLSLSVAEMLRVRNVENSDLH
jgi:hypothetical protein